MDWQNAMHTASDYWDANLPEIENICESNLEAHEPLAIINDDPWLNLDSWSPVPRSPALSELDELNQVSKKHKNQWSFEEDEFSGNDETPRSGIIHLNPIENSQSNIEQNSNPIHNKLPEGGHKKWKNKHDSASKKNKWTHEEDCLIVKLYNTYGGNWKKIAGYLKGRPSVAVKNRYYGTIKRKMSSIKKDPEKKKPALLEPKDQVKYMGKAWNEDELIDSLLSEPGKTPPKPPTVANLSVSLESMNFINEIKNVNSENLSAEEKRRRLQELYKKMATLEAFVNQTKMQIKNIEELKTVHN
ncbi:unnamed protein product [Blepharisma stoltei]|uniref:Myb-like DNA-binding domain containing protein n=1 Tax=Blepharisma stoltei TaxID=1481888 RepID=A0AAU9IT22_9CILI|nr:unnamed protein product [Blepharisma stoltei]